MNQDACHSSSRQSGRARSWTSTSWCGFAMIVLLASGCAGTGPQQWLHQHCKVGPDYCPPPAPVASDWLYADDPHVQRRQIEDWWTVFQDPTLNSLIERAYQQNLNLRVLGARSASSPRPASDRGRQPLSANAASLRPV